MDLLHSTWIVAAEAVEPIAGEMASIPWKYILVGGLAAGIVRFLWGAIAWMAIKHHDDEWRPVPDRADFEATLSKANLEPGYFYVVPHVDEFGGKHNSPELAARMNQGPNAMIVPLKNGPAMSGGTFARGFLFNFIEGVGVAFLTLIFWKCGGQPMIDTLFRTVTACSLLGLLISVATLWSQSNWMMIPWKHSLAATLDHIAAYAMMGATLWWVGGKIVGVFA